MKTIKLLIALALIGYHGAYAQLTMSAYLSLAKKDIRATSAFFKDQRWKLTKTSKLSPSDLTDVNGKYAHFTNCFFLLPEYKAKFKVEAGPKGNGVYRDIYIKSKDTAMVYYYSVDTTKYPVGLIYKTGRAKLPKVVAYLRHNKYTQTFSRDSITTYEIRRSVENLTINRESSTSVEYYIDRCWKYAGQRRDRGKSK